MELTSNQINHPNPRKEGEQEEETYQTYKNATVVITIDTDQTATANICNLRFLGILAGTKLTEMSKRSPTPKAKRKREAYFTLAWRVATGLGTFSGVAASLDRRSLSVEADRVLVSFSFGLVGCFASFRLLPGACRLTPLPFKVFAIEGIDNEKEREEGGKSATTTMVAVINQGLEEQEEWNGLVAPYLRTTS